jgi:primary-amine oxidase
MQAEELTRLDSLSVELMMPNKTEIVPLLSGNSTDPDRNAMVTIMFGAAEVAYMQDFMVGPFPITNATTMHPYTFRNNNGGDGKINVVNADNEEYVVFNEARIREAEDVTKFLWNMVSSGEISARIYS